MSINTYLLCICSDVHTSRNILQECRKINIIVVYVQFVFSFIWLWHNPTPVPSTILVFVSTQEKVITGCLLQAANYRVSQEVVRLIRYWKIARTWTGSWDDNPVQRFWIKFRHLDIANPIEINRVASFQRSNLCDSWNQRHLDDLKCKQAPKSR